MDISSLIFDWHYWAGAAAMHIADQTLPYFRKWLERTMNTRTNG